MVRTHESGESRAGFLNLSIENFIRAHNVSGSYLQPHSHPPISPDPSSYPTSYPLLFLFFTTHWVHLEPPIRIRCSTVQWRMDNFQKPYTWGKSSPPPPAAISCSQLLPRGKTLWADGASCEYRVPRKYGLLFLGTVVIGTPENWIADDFCCRRKGPRNACLLVRSVKVFQPLHILKTPLWAVSA